MKIRFFAGIHKDKAQVDTRFRVRVMDLSILKPYKVSLIADEEKFFVNIHCENSAFDCEYMFNDYEIASKMFVDVNDYIERNKRAASSSSSNADVMAAVFYQP